VNFSLFAYHVMFSGTLSVIRSVCFGSATLVIISSMAYGVMMVTTPAVVLSVTFNPSLVSVLLHTVCYMITLVGIASFMLAEVFVNYLHSGMATVKHIAFYAYSSVMIGLVVYALFFMTSILATTDQIDVLKSTRDERNILNPMPVKYDVMPLLGSFLFHPMHLVRPFVCPLAEVPIAGTFQVHRGRLTRMSVALSGDREWCIVLKSSVLAGSAAVMACCSVFVALYANNIAHGGLSQISSFRKEFTVLPGAAIVAYAWTLIVPLLFLHAFVIEMYVSTVLPQLKIAMRISVAMFCISATLAHGGTVPESPAWYVGSELFQVALMVWLILQSALVIYEWPVDMKQGSVCLLVCTVVAVISLAISLGTGDFRADIIWLISWLVCALVDPLDISITVCRISLGTSTNIPMNCRSKLLHCIWKEDDLMPQTTSQVSVGADLKCVVIGQQGNYLGCAENRWATAPQSHYRLDPIITLDPMRP
jgi:hypothetical protein